MIEKKSQLCLLCTFLKRAIWLVNIGASSIPFLNWVPAPSREQSQLSAHLTPHYAGR